MLNLNDMKVETEVVKFNDQEFIVDPDISSEIVKEMQELGDHPEKSKEVIIKILSIRNDPKKVKAFIEPLGMLSFGRVSTFISNFLIEVMRKKD